MPIYQEVTCSYTNWYNIMNKIAWFYQNFFWGGVKFWKILKNQLIHVPNSVFYKGLFIYQEADFATNVGGSPCSGVFYTENPKGWGRIYIFYFMVTREKGWFIWPTLSKLCHCSDLGGEVYSICNRNKVKIWYSKTWTIFLPLQWLPNLPKYVHSKFVCSLCMLESKDGSATLSNGLLL